MAHDLATSRHGQLKASNTMDQAEEYRLSFTSGGLLYEESARIAELYVEMGNWEATKEKALSENVLQARTESSNIRRVREVCDRLQGLTTEQLGLFLDAARSDQLLLLWLAVCKRYALLREFADEVVRGAFLSLQLVLGRQEFSRFLDEKSIWHPEIDELSKNTREKLARTAFQMLREAGIVTAELIIQPVLLANELLSAIVRDSPELLRIYPVADSDLPGAAL